MIHTNTSLLNTAICAQISTSAFDLKMYNLEDINDISDVCNLHNFITISRDLFLISRLCAAFSNGIDITVCDFRPTVRKMSITSIVTILKTYDGAICQDTIFLFEPLKHTSSF